MPSLNIALTWFRARQAVLLCTIGLLVLGLSNAAHADNVQWSIGVNSGGYYAPPPGVSVQIGNGNNYHHRRPPQPQVIVVQPPAPIYVTPAPGYKPGRGHYQRPPPRHGHRGHNSHRNKHRH